LFPGEIETGFDAPTLPFNVPVMVGVKMSDATIPSPFDIKSEKTIYSSLKSKLSDKLQRPCSVSFGGTSS